MLTVFLSTIAAITIFLVVSARAEEAQQLKVYRKPQLKTGTMGGVDNPTKDELLKMHTSQYILYARGGKLSKVPVEKTWLPGDPADMSHQEIMGRLVLTEDGTVIVIDGAQQGKQVLRGRTHMGVETERPESGGPIRIRSHFLCKLSRTGD